MIAGEFDQRKTARTETFLAQTSAYKTRIKTDSADSNALLLLVGGELIAILVELDDESHGEARGQWFIEATFGMNFGSRPDLFASAADAANWVSQHVCHRPFALNHQNGELR